MQRQAAAAGRQKQRWHLPVGLSLSQEIGYQRPQYSTDTWTWEIRPIIDQTLGRVYWSLNPVLERALRGQNAAGGFEFAPSVPTGNSTSVLVQA